MRRILSFLLVCVVSAAAAGQESSILHNSNLRSQPSTDSTIVRLLPSGSTVTVISNYPRQGYMRVLTEDDASGWVWKRNVKEAEAPTSALLARRRTPATEAPAARVGDSRIYPNAQMTPGKADPSVTQSNLAKTICDKAWSTESVRPAESVTNKIKQQTMKAYGFTDAANHYELDHLLSLQNGGCPDCVENLWPEAYGDPGHPMTQNERAAWNRANPASDAVLAGSLEKDLVENHIHDEICRDIPNGKMSAEAKKYPATVTITLERAQQILATDWYGCYRAMIDGNRPCE